MSQKKSYSRYFIILQEDEKGYGVAADKLPTGYAKLEVKNGKCKISFYVQNLKKEMKPYHMILIFNKNNSEKKLIKLAELNIDDTGRAEVSKDYDADNVANTGMQIDKICGAAVSRFVDTNMTSVMSGFTSTTSLKDWKSYELIDVSKHKEKTKFDEYEEKIEKSKEEVKHIKKEEIEKLKHEPKTREKIELPKETEQKQDVKDEITVKSEKKSQRKEDKVENINVDKVESEENHSAEDVLKEELNAKEVKNHDRDDNSSNNSNGSNENLSRCNKECKTKKSKSDEFFESITEDLEEWDDDFEEISDCKWFRIDVRNIDDMYKAKSYNKFTTLYYPMTNYYPYIIRHGHYMVGYKYDKSKKVKYLAYAIPGTKAHYDQPFGGKYGFVSWTQPKHDKGKYGNMGYWLMFYDFRKSVVVIPANR